MSKIFNPIICSVVNYLNECDIFCLTSIRIMLRFLNTRSLIGSHFQSAAEPAIFSDFPSMVNWVG